MWLEVLFGLVVGEKMRMFGGESKKKVSHQKLFISIIVGESIIIMMF